MERNYNEIKRLKTILLVKKQVFMTIYYVGYNPLDVISDMVVEL